MPPKDIPKIRVHQSRRSAFFAMKRSLRRFGQPGLVFSETSLTLKPQFVTQYHVLLATNEWLRSLETYISNSIQLHPEYQTSTGCGTVSSRYNEERFMGPLSLIKNEFNVTAQIIRRLTPDTDRYEVTVRYVQESNEFVNLWENVETVESKRRDNRRFRLVQMLCRNIANGCSRSIVDKWRCPWCRSEVRVSFHRLGHCFTVSCRNHHFHKHESTTTPPDWWRDAVTGGWYEGYTGDGTSFRTP